MFHKKLGFGIYLMAIVWCLSFLFFIFLFGGLSVSILQIVMEEGRTFETGYLDVIYWPLLFYSICFFLWFKNIFRRTDFIRLAKNEGVKLLKGVPYIVVVLTSWARSIVRGHLDGIYVIAKLQGGFALPVGLGYYTSLTADVLDKTDQVGFAFLLSSPINGDVEIHIEGEKRQLPQTGLPEIDEILQDALKDVNDFRATLAFNREYICLTIIGGVWFGKRFQERIIKGFEIAKKMNETLKGKYQYKGWNDYDMKWDFTKNAFVLVEKMERYAIFS